MPFITKDRRAIMDLPEKDRPADFEPQPGDWCYEYYKPMVEEWRAKPRWTTAHKIYTEMMQNRSAKQYWTNKDSAWQLAWQAFFYFHVLPYEKIQRDKNGDV